MNRIVKNARAKINLCLDVTGIRPNGYHDVRMVMQTVGLWDSLELIKTDTGISMECDTQGLTVDDKNIAYRAADLFIQERKIAGGVHIILKKRIPMAAGLAGGSTDAAAVLLALNELYECGAGIKELCDIGVRIGADVPYCIIGGTCLAAGIGEVLTELPACPDCYIVLAKPPIDVSTKYVYEHLDERLKRDEMCKTNGGTVEGQASRPDDKTADGVRLAPENENTGGETCNSKNIHPCPDGMIQALEEGSLERMTAAMGNILAIVTEENYPVISQIKKELLALGALNAMMSGSGPTVFGIFTDKGQADAAAEVLCRNSEYGDVFSVPVSNEKSRDFYPNIQ